jgi:hypothetical protein
LLALTGVWWKKSRAEGRNKYYQQMIFVLKLMDDCIMEEKMAQWKASTTVGLGEMYEVLALADLTPL